MQVKVTLPVQILLLDIHPILFQKLRKLRKDNPTYHESELIKEIESGNTVAFDQLYRQFYPALSLLAFNVSKSREAAQDIVSDVFLHLWEGRGAIRNVVDIKAYLYISTRNRTFNYLKSKSLRSVEALNEQAMAAQEPSADTFFQTLLETETIRALREGIDLLPAECKKVIELVLKGYSTNEISHLLGISASAVSHQKSRAVRILKDKIFLAVLMALPTALMGA